MLPSLFLFSARNTRFLDRRPNGHGDAVAASQSRGDALPTGGSAAPLWRVLRTLSPPALTWETLRAGEPPRSPAPLRRLGGCAVLAVGSGFSQTVSTAMATPLPPLSRAGTRSPRGALPPPFGGCFAPCLPLPSHGKPFARGNLPVPPHPFDAWAAAPFLPSAPDSFKRSQRPWRPHCRLSVARGRAPHGGLCRPPLADASHPVSPCPHVGNPSRGEPPRSPAPLRRLGGCAVLAVGSGFFQTVSTAMATPLPPPRQSETIPLLAPRSLMA